ncbi:MAG TPA: PRC-barrel domain-containing protein [bacterium]|nr:PRC-barrel domain-containing protein [bacterium]
MLFKIEQLKGYQLQSFDGKIGGVKEFYFDDHHWTVRYLVADTGRWLTDRQVLISPYALAGVNGPEKTISVALTRKQIEESPSLDSDKPVSRQFEEEYHGFYGWPMYWGGPYMWGAYPGLMRDREKQAEPPPARRAWDPHLCSSRSVTGHTVQASDGEIGHVDDFILDDETWAVRYLVVDTGNWWPGKKVLVSTRWIESVGWDRSKVFVGLTRETIQQSPEYDGESLVVRDYEAELHRHYNRRGYWEEELAAQKRSAEPRTP